MDKPQNSAEKPFENEVYTLTEGPGPLIATAIHDGHDLREEVARIIKLGEAERRREEDPYTSCWVDVAETRLVALRSRFEVDLNRPREKAVYLTPHDCWGLDVWRQPPTDEVIERSLEEYDAYYAALRDLLTAKQNKYGKFVLYDIHSYNHRRDGPGAAPESPALNPEINVGTGTMDRERWAPLVDRFISDLRSFDFAGRQLDVRENVKFRGGHQVRWLHENFARSGCGLAIEFKKFWMNEWNGEKDEELIDLLGRALSSTVPGVLAELDKMPSKTAAHVKNRRS